MEKNESDIIPILKVWETQAYFFNVVKAYRKGMLISVCMFMEDYMGQNIFIGLLCVIALLAGIWSWLLERGYSFGKYNDKKEEGREEKIDEKN